VLCLDEEANGDGKEYSEAIEKAFLFSDNNALSNKFDNLESNATAYHELITQLFNSIERQLNVAPKNSLNTLCNLELITECLKLPKIIVDAVRKDYEEKKYNLNILPYNGVKDIITPHAISTYLKSDKIKGDLLWKSEVELQPNDS